MILMNEQKIAEFNRLHAHEMAAPMQQRLTAADSAPDLWCHTHRETVFSMYREFQISFNLGHVL